MDQKGSQIAGGLMNDEFLASSKSVLQGHRGRTSTKGSQQFFTPEPVAEFAARCLSSNPGEDPRPVCDPVGAGSGALLRPWAHRYGVEVDSDYEHGRYKCIRGDCQQVIPMATAIGLQFPVIVCNSAFGLNWTYGGESARSARVGWRMVLDVMDEGGVGCMIMPKSDYMWVLENGGANRVREVFEIPDMFGPSVEVDCVLFFFTKEASYYPVEIKRHGLAIAELTKEQAGEVHARLDNHVYGWRWNGDDARKALNKDFDALRQEFKDREAAGGRRSCLEFNGKKIKIYLSPYEQIRLVNEGKRHVLTSVARLNGQSAYKLAQDESEWEQLQVLARDGDLEISEDVIAKYEALRKEVEFIYAPFLTSNALSDRLAALRNCKEIKCKKGDVEKGYVAGEKYPVYSQTVAVESRGERAVQKKEKDAITGEQMLVWKREQYLQTGRAVRYDIGQHSFTIATDRDAEQMKYIGEHFDLPEVKGLADLRPGEFLKWKNKVRAVITQFDWDDPFTEVG